MAYAMSLQVLELSCAVCHDIFQDPVLLSCGHSFCKGCLRSWWTQSRGRQCPLCKRRCSRDEPPSNLALKNLSEPLRTACGDFCVLHGEKLKLFGLDLQETVCVVCRESEKHADHRFRPVDEAAPGHREELTKLLERPRKTLSAFVETKKQFDHLAAHVEAQAAAAERQIQKEFQKLHRFLQVEEETRTAALRDEEKMKGQRLKGAIEKLSRQIETLSGVVEEAEAQLGEGDISFLRNFKATRGKVAGLLPLPRAPALPKGALVDVAKHLGNLAHAAWVRLGDEVSHVPVVLDPNTAAADLHLSEDLTGARRGAARRLPQNPERLRHGALGSGFAEAGIYCWEVEVGDSAQWELGVSLASYEEKQKLGNAKAVGFLHHFLPVDRCKIGFFDGVYRLSSSNKSGEWVDLPAMRKLHRIRMRLDLNAYEVSFVEPKTNKTIYSCRNLAKTLQLLFICSTDTGPLKISAVKEL